MTISHGLGLVAAAYAAAVLSAVEADVMIKLLGTDIGS
jgi:hypothetical protein